MAIDKNSKAYQWLLNKWYTDAEITQMSESVNSWKTTQQAFDEVKSQRATAQSTPTSTGGSYVYNPTSWYYEKQSTPSTTTTTTTGDEFGRNNQTTTQTVPEVKQETETKQAETVGSAVPEIQQQGALKPLSQDYYNQTSDEAQSKIINNLNNYRQTNPEYFRDYESFKKNFSYDARNDEQKQTLDSWYGGYQKWMELAWIPVTDLYTQYKDGQVSMNELENLRIYDPNKYAELQAQINKWNIISAYDDDKGEDGTWLSLQDMAYNTAVQMFTKFLSGDSSSGASQYFRDYEEKMESPEMLALSDQCTEVQEQMENIQSDLDSIKKSVEEEYAGTWATRSKINAIIADRSYDLQLQLRTLNSEYNKYATQYNNRMQQYQNEFNMQLQEYQLNQDARNQQMKELWFAMDLMNFETNDQKQQREWDYWVKQQEYTNWNINSKDYDTRYKAALKSVQNLLSQYEGIPMQRSAEQMADDILKAIDNGSDLGTELTKINKQIQGKPEYKYLYNQTYAPASVSSAWWIQDTMKVWDMEYVKYNDQWYTADDFNKMFSGAWAIGTWTAKPYDLVDESAFRRTNLQNSLWSFLLKKSNHAWNKWWQCGKYVNDYLQEIGVGRYYDNELSTKLNSVNSYAPKEWTIAVFDYNHKSADWVNYGHVWIVTQVYADWSFDVMDSNYWSDEKIQKRHIKPWSSSLKGFFDPSKPPMSNSSQSTGNSSFVSWSIEWVPLAYERAVKNLVPAALQNSDAEREALNTVITNSYNWGIDQSQIALTFMWFDIKNDADKKLALELVNTTRTLNSETQEWIVQTISDLINQWNYAKAIQTVENAVSQQAKSDWNYVSEASVKNTINKANELSKYMNGLKKSPVWVVEWTMQDWLWKLSSKDAKEIQNRIALIESSLDIKDKDTLQKIVPQLSDQPSVFASKLQNLWDNAMVELNGWRTIYGLPALTQDSVLNHSNRVDLYKNWTVQGQTTSTQDNNQTLQMNMQWAIRSLNARFWLK